VGQRSGEMNVMVEAEWCSDFVQFILKQVKIIFFYLNIFGIVGCIYVCLRSKKEGRTHSLG
jgi:hypothetical protein